MSRSDLFDVIIVGAGHAGVEAALACARMGVSTALLTMDAQAVGRMSCNPAIGGLAKGHLVREIDALGGEMGKATDDTSIQSRVLNRSQGPAVWGYRAQCDKHRYSARMREAVLAQAGLELVEAMVTDLIVTEGVVGGVVDERGCRYAAKAVVLTTGTFLNGLMHIGETKIAGGRTGERAAHGLSDRLRELGFEVGRLKTGTNPRVKKGSIDFTRTTPQGGDANPVPFSFSTRTFPVLPQVECHITSTQPSTHRVIRENIHRSPLFSGEIQGVGPRYCPSIEDKVVKFPDRDHHQVFLEPEGLDTDEYYLNGLSTSLPLDVQEAYLHTVPGLERAVIARPGYAVEYDFVPPTQVTHSLETKKVRNLFLAGQINGTSGYEEAAAQGLMAGINAVLRVKRREPFVLARTEAYIGVMVDDLVTRGTEEPYRMFTSRAEYRLLLRPDNADLRLTEWGHQWGLVSKETAEGVRDKKEAIRKALDILKETPVPLEATQGKDAILAPRDRAFRLDEVLRRPGFTLEALGPHRPPSLHLATDVAFQVEVELKYEGYLSRQREEIAQRARFEGIRLPGGDFLDQVKGVSREAMEKIRAVGPATVGQAARIPGVTPSDVTVLILALSRWVSGIDKVGGRER
jgi:tRNA uridine 5-carboxymethylaminomethyl modification enzyme